MTSAKKHLTYTRLLSTLTCIILFPLRFYGTDQSAELLAEADKLYSVRALVIKNDRADSENIDSAIKLYSEIANGNTSTCEAVQKAAVGLMKSWYFKAVDTEISTAESRKIFEYGKTAGEGFHLRHPDNLNIHYWYLVLLGKWAEFQNIAAIAKEGLLGKLKNGAEYIIKKDPGFDSGNAHLMLGRMHYMTPRIPLIISWPSIDEAVKNYHKALEINPEYRMAMIYLAECYIKQKKKEEARTLLTKVVSLPLRDKFLFDDTNNRKIASDLLANL